MNTIPLSGTEVPQTVRVTDRVEFGKVTILIDILYNRDHNRANFQIRISLINHYDIDVVDASLSFRYRKTYHPMIESELNEKLYSSLSSLLAVSDYRLTQDEIGRQVKMFSSLFTKLIDASKELGLPRLENEKC